MHGAPASRTLALNTTVWSSPSPPPTALIRGVHGAKGEVVVEVRQLDSNTALPSCNCVQPLDIYPSSFSSLLAALLFLSLCTRESTTWSKTSWAQVTTESLPCCVVLGKFLTLSELKLLTCTMVDQSSFSQSAVHGSAPQKPPETLLKCRFSDSDQIKWVEIFINIFY